MKETKRHRVKRAPLNTYDNGAFWGWFGLSYASYLVLPRRVLCSMPAKWQERMVALINEIPETLELETKALDGFVVMRRGPDGRYEADPLREYRRAPTIPRRQKGRAA